MSISIIYINLAEREEPTEAYQPEARIFYKVITPIRSVAFQNKECASYL